MSISPNPNEVVDTKDHGDDVQRRFRYQCTYAAMISLFMFEDNAQVEEIYCELHEDILLKLNSGLFIGVQIKTRERHLGPFGINDAEIKKSIIRFISLEKRFKDKFKRYTIATNTGFVKTEHKSLQAIIDLANEGKIAELISKKTNSSKWLKSIIAEADCSIEEITSVLKKIKPVGDIPSIEDIPSILVEKIARFLHLEDKTIGILKNIAEKMILYHINASSKGKEDRFGSYFISDEEPENQEKKSILEGKKVTKPCIEKIIEGCQTDPISLYIKEGHEPQKTLGVVKKLEAKMDAGGISYENINLTKDQKYSIEMLSISWLYKYDKDIAEKQFNQVKLIVNSECREAYDNTYKETQFGTEMLREVRTRLKSRLHNDKESFFGCKYEHLLGMAGVLTEECTVWWSDKFNIPN